MNEFSVIGKVIGADRAPQPNLEVRAFDHHEIVRSDTLVGQSTTNAQGRFEIGFDDSAFHGLWERIAGVPRVYVTVIEPAGRVLATSRPVSTRWQIEVRIKLGGGGPTPAAPDVYSQELRRMTGSLREVGAGIQMERTLSQVHLMNGQLEASVRREEQAFLEGSEARTDQLNHLLALLDGVWSTYIEGTLFRAIGYDGPQTARNPWLSDDPEVIVWPRNERYRWA